MAATKLILEYDDLEARLGFRAGKYTSPNKTLAFIIAVLVWALLYGGLYLLPDQLRQTRSASLFCDRGIIPYFTTLAFLWGFAMVWLKNRKLSAQTGALAFLLMRNFGCYSFTKENAMRWHKWLDEIAEKPQDYMLLNRLLVALATLGNLAQPSELPNIMNHHAETDELQVDGSYDFIKMLLYSIPVLGFIGTVLGLGSAIGGFGETLTMGTENMDGLIGSLQGVAGGLSVAFDTTLLALVLTLILQVYASFARSGETAFLEDCNYFMQNEFFQRLREKSEADERFPWDRI
jgi:biopolymer transport protein ExbB/TolQ